MVGVSALASTSVTAPPPDVEATRVQLTGVEASAPTPNELLAALVAPQGVRPANPDVSTLGALAESGSITGPAATAIAVLVERFSAAALSGNLSDIDRDSAAMAIAVMIDGLSSGAEIGFFMWDAFHIVFDSVVAATAITAAATAVGVVNVLTVTLVDSLNALAESGVIPAPAASAMSALVGLFSTAVRTGVVGVGAGIALAASVDLALANAVSTLGRGIIGALTGVPGGEFPDLNLAALVAALHNAPPQTPDLPNGELPDLNLAALHNALPQVPDLPNGELPDLNLAALVAALHNALPQIPDFPHYPNGKFSGLMDMVHLVNGRLAGCQSHDVQESWADLLNLSHLAMPASADSLQAEIPHSPKHALPEMSQGEMLDPRHALPEIPQADLSGPRHALPEIQESGIVGPRHALPEIPNEGIPGTSAADAPNSRDLPKHDASSGPRPDRQNPISQSLLSRSPDTSESVSAQLNQTRRVQASQNGSNKPSENDSDGASTTGSKGEAGSGE